MPDRFRFDAHYFCSAFQRIGNKLGSHMVGGKPANNLFRATVDDRREVDKSSPHVNVGDVDDEFNPVAISGEVLPEKVGNARDSGSGSIRGGRHLEWSRLAGHQTELAHDLTYQLWWALGSLRDQSLSGGYGCRLLPIAGEWLSDKKNWT